MMCSIGYVRTNIVIDEELIEAAMTATGAKTRRETVDRALREVVSREKRLRILDLAGVGWEGDLEEMRGDRDLD